MIRVTKAKVRDFMLEEYELLELIRDNDSDAFAKLSEKYSGLTQSLVRKFSRDDMTREDIEDLSQEAQMLLYKAARTYNKESGLAFGLYARICIRNGFITLMRKQNNEVKRINAEISDVELSVPDTTDNIDEAESAEALMEKIKEVLSDRELAVFKYLTLDYKHPQIAKEMKISVKSVENTVFRIKKKLGTLLF